MHRNSGGLRIAAGWLYALAGIVGVASVVFGLLLMTHSVCGVNPFDASLSDCTESTHPFVLAGLATLIGGLINAAVIATVAHLCEVVEDLREYRDADAAVVLEQMGDEEPGDEPGAPSLYGHKG